jgi:Flp pilus assembly protein TadD
MTPPLWHEPYHRGQQLTRENKLPEALGAFERAVSVAPDAMEPRRELASTLYQLGRLGEAVRQFEEVVARFPANSEAANNLASVLVAADAFERAFEAVQNAVALDPANVVALHNLAEILKHLGNWEAARDVYEAALELDPDRPAARMQYGMTQLALGDWRAGWPAFESRIDAIGPQRLFAEAPSSPRWSGSQTLEGKRLLIMHEQGFGDSIMMARFARQLVSRGASVHLRCPAPLVELLATVPDISGCTAVGSAMPAHDLHAPLMSLPFLLQTMPEQVDGSPYLTPVGICPAAIAALLPGDQGPTVALTWSGNPAHINDRRRSMRGALLEPLLDTPGVRFVAMQKSPSMTELLSPALQSRLVDLAPVCASFNDSAHALQRVDLCVTVDTSVAHLAGALGTPTLLCLPFYPDFRWGVSGTRTPWYDRMTILRQEDPSGWGGVLTEVGRAVERLRDRGKHA